MEQTPADARAAPSASGPTDMATETPPSPKRPRDPSSDNKVSQRSTSFDPVWPERQIVTTGNMSTAPASACQSLAHPTTPMGRWLKSADCAGLFSVKGYRVAAHPHHWPKGSDDQTILHCFRAEHASKPSLAQSGSLLNPNLQHAVQARGKLHSKQRTTPVKWAKDRQYTPSSAILTTATLTLTKYLTLTPPPPPLSQGKNKPPPRPPPIVEEAMEEGDDPTTSSPTRTTSSPSNRRARRSAKSATRTWARPLPIYSSTSKG
eukprot:scaffold7442_cov101-Isochrysis_galbana.AAC.4